MSQNNSLRPSTGKIVVGSVLALILAFLLPQVLMFQLMTFNLGVVAMAGVALTIWAGPIPGILLAVAGAANMMYFYGFQVGAVLLPMAVAPPVAVALGVRGRRPFFQQMQVGLIAFLAGTVVTALLAAIAFGGDIVARVVAMIGEVFDEIGPEVWTIVQPSMEALDPSITFEQFSEAFGEVLALIQAYYELYLLANLLAGAAVTAIVSVFWGNWLAARRGEATVESFVGLHGWYLPANLTWGILMTLAAAWILANTAISGGTTTWLVVLELAEVAFVVQALAAIDRRLKARGSTRGRRTAAVVLILLAGMLLSGLGVFELLMLVGGASALFGSHGAARPIVEKIKKTFGGDDR